MRKVLFSFLLIVLASLLATNILYADSFSKQNGEESELVFDLDATYQEKKFYDSNGILTIISVQSSRLSGEKTISMSNTYLSMSYKIMVNNNIITNAYDGSYSTTYYSVSGESLTVDSNTQATYSLTCKVLLVTVNKYLRANISNGSIVVSHN